MSENAVSLELKNFNKLHATIERKFGALTKDKSARALRTIAEVEMTEAKKRTPVDTGVLRSSGLVIGPEQVGGVWQVRMVFGGPAAPYAAAVHENLEAFHKVGQAKYLESVMLELRPYFAARLAAAMRS
ncbi:MAG TPA: hypothetical protein DCP69_12810 [Candidatus Omnitrophica bacterium]|nr:hypothetical protein [Candidatus Omnitrophota bacterium]